MIPFIIALLIALFPVPPWPPTHHTELITILSMGDSITHGYASTDGTGYRGPFHEQIHYRYVGGEGEEPLLHEGHPGWTIDQLADSARLWVSSYRPSHVIVNGGSNDDGLGRTAEEMLTSMRRLIAEVRAGMPRVVIIVLSIPITTLNTPAQQQQERDYNAALPTLGVRVVDIADVPLADQVHPNDAGYQIIADRLAAQFGGVRMGG